MSTSLPRAVSGTLALIRWYSAPAVIAGPDHRFGTGSHIELGVETAEIVAYGLITEMEGVGDTGAAPAASKVDKELTFALGEFGNSVRRVMPQLRSDCLA